MSDEYFGPADDPMIGRCAMILEMAKSAHDVKDAKSRELLHEAMEVLLYSISPRMGQVVALPGATGEPGEAFTKIRQ